MVKYIFKNKRFQPLRSSSGKFISILESSFTAVTKNHQPSEIYKVKETFLTHPA